MELPKTPHTALFIGKTGCGKTHYALDLLEGPYRAVYEQIFILCPTTRDNQTYKSRSSLWKDKRVFFVDPSDGRLHKYIEVLSDLYSGVSTLFIIDDCAAERELGQKRQALSKLAMSGRHRYHSLWIMTQSYTSVLADVRRQTEWIALFHCKSKKCFDTAMEENTGVPPGEFDTIRATLAATPRTKLILISGPPMLYSVEKNDEQKSTELNK